MRIGELIKKWRAMSEIPIRQAASDIGIGISTLSRIENGEACDSIALTKILRWALDASFAKNGSR